MIEHEIIKLQIVSTVKLTVASYLLFFWVPKRVFPQEYIDNSLDRAMFNIIHMVALITLIFPLFIYLKFFGFLFLIIFFVLLKLFFLKFYHQKNLSFHFSTIYKDTITKILIALENPYSYIGRIKSNFAIKAAVAKSHLTTTHILYVLILLISITYALYLRSYRGYISLTGAVSDMYQYYYWDNILKGNNLFPESVAGYYMWSFPVLVFTVNLLASLNTVVLYNIFPIIYLSFIFFSIFYVLKKNLEIQQSTTASVLIACTFFGIIIPSPISQHFFGFVFKTSSPETLSFFYSTIYPGVLNPEVRIFYDYPFYFFWRFTTTLPYEIGASFFLVNIYFLVKFIESKKHIYLLLYAEVLAIIFSIHGGIALPLFFPSLLIFLYSFLTRKFDMISITKLFAAIIVAIIAGNIWMTRMITAGIPQNVGKSAPILDTLFGTKRGVRDLLTTDIYSVQIVSPSIGLSLLLLASLILLVVSIFYKQHRFRIVSLACMSIGILFVYFAPNLGLPMLVDHSRLQVFIAYSYAIISAVLYFIAIEKGVLNFLCKKWYLKCSILLCSIVILLSIFFTPRWIDTAKFHDNIYTIEHKEFPYLIIQIQDTFQPFTYTVVSYVQQFPQLFPKGFHINTQDLIQRYNPADDNLEIPTEYIFIFMENYPKDYQGLGEYWYRWRRDIMLKLKDWIAIYSQTHDNMRLWYSSRGVDVYFIDNRTPEGSLLRQRESMRETSR